MSKLESIEPPILDTTKIHLSPGEVKIAGTITAKNPAEQLAPFLKEVHDATVADGAKELRINVHGLTFVNSSSIRLFIDWAMRVKAEPEEKRYTMRFITNSTVTWQTTSFSALKSLVGDIVSVETGAASG